jgi:hypothetical protein
MAKLTKTRAQELYDRKLSLDAASKQMFKESDEIDEELILGIQASPELEIKLGDGRVLTLEDQFVDKDGRFRNKAFKIAACPHFKVVAKTALPVPGRGRVKIEA